MKYLEGLNERQRQAAEHFDGPLLIVAGAGAGKTKTITHRVACLIARGVPAREILAVTFTNKAAGEMRERVRALLGAAETPLVCTFHALGVRILREFHAEAGVPRGFSIWDRDDSVRALKRLLENEKGETTARAVLSAISRHKGDGIEADDYAAEADNFRKRLVARAWRQYEKVLAEEGALDFDDLLCRALKLLRNNPRVLSLLQERWKYITIDEYQDTNRVQYELAKLLAGERKNLCVVGDIDQTIYSWRGADIAHLLSFERSFPGARVIVLEQNYRSTRTILAAANDVIAKNSRRLEKHLFTEKETGAPITLYGARNELDEAWFVAETCQRLIERAVAPQEIAVLYRENFQSRAIEEALLALAVPYRVVGTRFFERKEVKDVLSYLRAALNPQSASDIARIAGVPPRGIGKVTLEAMRREQDESLPAGARLKVAAFRQSLARIEAAAQTAPASEAIRFALEESGMEAMHRQGGDEGRERLLNVRELVNLAARYDFEQPPRGIELLLEQAALESEQDELSEEKAAVSLLTVHASKGLEFDAVFVSGLEQGLFPSLRQEEARDDEEERRLFYVALTRARKLLFLSYAAERMRWGSRDLTTPSEFIGDIDRRLIAAPRAHDAEEEAIIE